jgi:uncharacterized protein HemX
MPALSSNIIEVPATPHQSIPASHNFHSWSDGMWLVASLGLSVVGYTINELAKLHIKRKTAELDAELEREKAEQQEKIMQIERLEKQNQILFDEVLKLSTAMDRSGPLSIKMYEPK